MIGYKVPFATISRGDILGTTSNLAVHNHEDEVMRDIRGHAVMPAATFLQATEDKEKHTHRLTPLTTAGYVSSGKTTGRL